MLLSIIAVVILLLLSAFFSGSGTALTEASPVYHHDRDKNLPDRRSHLHDKLALKQDRFILTALLGSNLANTLATSLLTSLFIGFFGNQGIAYATIIMTFLVLIYTDMLPKNYAVRHANQMASAVTPLINVFVKLFSPLVWILQIIISLTSRLFGLGKATPESAGQNSLSEVRGAIYQYEGKNGEPEKAMLKSILDLTDVEVYDVMNHRSNLFSLDIATPISEILKKVKNCPFSRIPIYREVPENIVGVIRVKTLFKAAVESGGDYAKIKLEDLMTAPWFIPDNTTLMQQLQLFRARREHFAIVVDEYGDLQGIVTLEDILEEIVGDINDESDIQNLDTMGIRKCPEGNGYMIDGQVPIRDLNRKFGWTISDDNAVTIAGYLLDMTQSIPEPGQKFIFDDFQFEVLKRRKNQISLIRITPQR